MTIKKLREETARGARDTGIPVQVQSVTEKLTKGGKPYLELTVADSTGSLSLKVWNDSIAFARCQKLEAREFIMISGEFKSTEYGIEAPRWDCRTLSEDEKAALLAGDPEQIERTAYEFEQIDELVATMRSEILREVCQSFLINPVNREQFARAAAARGNHHARRGGLVAHTSRMMQAAATLALVYHERLNRSLLIAGALFHDVGKLVENQYEADGFLMPFSQAAELFGHIAIGVEMVRKLFRTLEARAVWAPGAIKENEFALCHLILSHHGSKEWGSPVEPKMMEAQVLHFIDNIDAKVEMMADGYAKTEIAPGVFEKSYPLRVNLVRSPSEENAETLKTES